MFAVAIRGLALPTCRTGKVIVQRADCTGNILENASRTVNLKRGQDEFDQDVPVGAEAEAVLCERRGTCKQRLRLINQRTGSGSGRAPQALRAARCCLLRAPSTSSQAASTPPALSANPSVRMRGCGRLAVTRCCPAGRFTTRHADELAIGGWSTPSTSRLSPFRRRSSRG